MTPASAPVLPTPDLDRRFSALERLYGVAAAQRIRKSHVVVVGVGGVGPVAGPVGPVGVGGVGPVIGPVGPIGVGPR